MSVAAEYTNHGKFLSALLLVKMYGWEKIVYFLTFNIWHLYITFWILMSNHKRLCEYVTFKWSNLELLLVALPSSNIKEYFSKYHYTGYDWLKNRPLYQPEMQFNTII